MTTWVKPVLHGIAQGPTREELISEVRELKDALASALTRLDAATDEFKAAAAPLQARLDEIDEKGAA